MSWIHFDTAAVQNDALYYIILHYFILYIILCIMWDAMSWIHFDTAAVQNDALYYIILHYFILYII